MKIVTKIDKVQPLKTEKKILRVAAYCRVSTDSDAQLESLETQKKHYESYITSHGDWELVGIYFDEGITETKAEKRPKLMRLIADCKAKKIDFVITKSISRFSRNTTDCLEIVRTLLNLNIPIYFEKENLNTGSMESKLFLSILSSMAEEESTSISENNKWSAKKRFKNGTYKLSYAPYGYCLVNGKLTIDKTQAEIVKRIFTELLSGKGTKAIAKILNQEQIPSQKGGRWTSASIRGIIANEKYIGDALLQKTYTVDCLSKKRVKNTGIVPQYYVEDDHEAIIPKDIFLRVQEELVRRRVVKTSANGKKHSYSCSHCFAQIVICGECGEMFRKIHWNDRGKKSVVWCCIIRLNDKNKCRVRTVSEEILKTAFLDALNEMVGESDSYLKRLNENLEAALNITNPIDARNPPDHDGREGYFLFTPR